MCSIDTMKNKVKLFLDYVYDKYDINFGFPKIIYFEDFGF